MVRVVDVFCYNGEPIVERRLRYLSDKVDCFVIIEARTTHSGIPKEHLFIDTHAEMFKPYRCEFVVVDEFPEAPTQWLETYGQNTWVLTNKEAWWREYYQREAALTVLRALAKETQCVFFVGDSDEIPSHDAIGYLKSNYATLEESPIHLSLDMFYYSFAWRVPETWTKSYAVSSAHVLHDISLTRLRNMAPCASLSQGSGWHCSYFMTAEEIERKLHSFAHCEVEIPPNIQECIDKGLDIAGRPITLIDSSSMPEPF